MQEIQSTLDALRYQHRLQDAVRHSRNLIADYTVAFIEPPRAFGRYSVRQQVSEESYSSHQRYRHLLQQLDREEYGEPALKRQKKSPRLPFEKENHALEQKKHDMDIRRRMKKELSRRREVRFGAGVGRREKLSTALDKQVDKVEKQSAVDEKQTAVTEEKQDVTDEKRDAAEDKTEEDEVSSLTQAEELAELTKSNDVLDSKVPLKYRDEIEELEARLKAQRLSRASEADRLFYDRLGERETNTLVEEVLLGELYDLAAEVYDEEEEKSRNKELPPELLEEVEEVLHDGPMEEVIVQKYNVDITRRHLQCLLPLQWLNDEIINFYFQMMSDRDAELVKAGVLEKRSHFFNSFFYTKVSEGGYNFINVRRWTRKIDLFSMDKIFVPVNVGNMHWCMATIFMTEKRIQYFDSMHGAGTACLNVLLRYLRDESEHKKKQKFDDAGWDLVPTTPDTPEQNNGSDCGVFSTMFADYLSQNLPLAFKQKDIPFHRHRMVLHISRGYLPLDEEGL